MREKITIWFKITAKVYATTVVIFFKRTPGGPENQNIWVQISEKGLNIIG